MNFTYTLKAIIFKPHECHLLGIYAHYLHLHHAWDQNDFSTYRLNVAYYLKNTVDSKIIRALEIIRVKKLMLNAVLWNTNSSRHDL